MPSEVFLPGAEAGAGAGAQGDGGSTETPKDAKDAKEAPVDAEYEPVDKDKK